MLSKPSKNKKRGFSKSAKRVLLLIGLAVAVAAVVVAVSMNRSSVAPQKGQVGDKTAEPKAAKAKVSSPPRQEVERYLVGEWLKKQAEEEVAKLTKSNFYDGDSKKIFDSINKLAAYCAQSHETQDYLAATGLKSDIPKMREIALIALGATMQDRVVNMIVQVLKNDDDFEVRRVAATSLCQQKADGVKKGFGVVDLGSSIGVGCPFSPLAWTALLDILLIEKSEKVKNTIADLLVLGDMPREVQFERYIDVVFESSFPSVLRKHIAYHIPATIDDEHKIRFAALAGNRKEDLGLRMACFQYLGRTGVPVDGLNPLAELLSDGTEATMLRLFAGHLLLKEGAPEILKTYEAVCVNKGDAVTASSPLARSNAVDAMLWIVSSDPDNNEAVKALKILGQIGDAGTAPRVKQAVSMRGASSVVSGVAEEVINQLQSGEGGVGG